MAITGTFRADFTQFDSAVQSAGSKLRAFEGDTSKSGTAIKTMTTEAGTATSVLGSMGAQLAGMFTLGAVVAFGRSVLEAGDSIQKMADQTGLSIAEVQKLNYVAGQSGSSIGSLVGAVQNLQQRLGDHDSGAAGAMKKLGINMEAFNKLGTYDQMTQLASGIRAIHDPTEQASIAADLFGKTWKEILPAIKGGMKEVGEAAPVMADATVQALDRVGDAQKRAQQQAIAWGGSVVLAIEGAGFAIGNYLSRFDPAHFGRANSEILAHETALAKLEGRVVQGTPPVLALGEAATGMGMSFADATATAHAMDAEITASITANTKAAAAVADHTDALTRHYAGLDKLKGGYDDLDRKLAAMESQLNAAASSNEIFDTGLKFTAETIETQVVPALETAVEQVRLLSGEMVSLTEAQALHAAGGSFAMTAITLAEMSDDFFKKRFGASKSGILGLLKQGFSMENAFAIYRSGFNPAEWVGDRGPRVPGFAAGGPVTSDGLIYAHAGEYVLPASGGGGGGTTVINLVVDGRTLATVVNAHNTRAVLQGKKVGSA
jgi:hypothetical protein